MQPTIEDIRQLLEKGDVSKFIGLKENDVFEAKNKNPYDVNLPSDRFELAKDISSFANSGGGYIIFGLKTEPLADERTDQVSELDLMSQADCLVEAYAGVARQQIYPTLNTESGWIESQNTWQGLAFIYISSQSEESKPFIFTKVIEEGRPQKEIIFGVAKRLIGSSDPLTHKSIHSMLQNGKNSASQKMSQIEFKIDQLISLNKKPMPRELPRSLFDKRIEKLLK